VIDMSIPKLKIMLDSGAFGAWKRDDPISVDEYVTFIKRNQELIHSYVNMDVIPGSKGRLIRTPESVEHSARKSYENLQRIKDKGLSPIPVFHQGERFEWLERLIDDHESYIGISPYLRSTPKEFHRWMDRCFGIIAKRQDKKQPIKTHGFGVTSVDALVRYPWTTADSVAWALKGGYGIILLPAFNGKDLDFFHTTTIHVSTRGSKKLLSYGTLRMDGKVRERIDEYIHTTLGVASDNACNLYQVRYELNILYMQGLQTQIRKLRQTNKFDIIFATAVDIIRGTILTKHNANFRLLSYFNLRSKKKEDNFAEYVHLGVLNKPLKHKSNWGNKGYLTRRTKYFLTHLEELSCSEQT
jgi:hypothetical protein